MLHLIDKDVLIAEIEKEIKCIYAGREYVGIPSNEENVVLGLQKSEDIINSIEVKEVNPYEQCVQYDFIKAGIQAHAETYSFNIESELFNQLKKEQQTLWKKEIEQAYINGGEVGVEFIKDLRYNENLEVKDVNLEEELNKEWKNCEPIDEGMGLEIASIEHEQFDHIAKHFFELGLLNQLTWQDIELIAKIGMDFMNSEDSDNLNDEEYYTEILNRFKAHKN